MVLAFLANTAVRGAVQKHVNPDTRKKPYDEIHEN